MIFMIENNIKAHKEIYLVFYSSLLHFSKYLFEFKDWFFKNFHLKKSEVSCVWRGYINDVVNTQWKIVSVDEQLRIQSIKQTHSKALFDQTIIEFSGAL